MGTTRLTNGFWKGGATLLAASLMLTACGVFSTEKNPPDEFEVVRNAPLVVPPNYNLRPPRPGERRPQEMDSQSQAIAALFPGRTNLPPPSAAETALVERASAGAADSDVRSTLGDEVTIVADKGVFLREILSTESGLVDTEGVAVDRVTSEPLDTP